MSEDIKFEISNQIASVTMNRVTFKNALNLSALQELQQTFRATATNTDVKVIVLSGSGEEAFCSGADLKELSNCKSFAEKDAFFSALSNLIVSMLESPQIIISKVHGYCLAGALGLIAASDIVVASDQARFALPELKVGMIPGIVILALERLLPKRSLQYLALKPEMIDASQALSLGLISEINEKAKLDQAVQDLAQRTCLASRDGLAATKRMLNADLAGFRSALKNRVLEMSAFTFSENCREGISAFLEKRKPVWRNI